MARKMPESVIVGPHTYVVERSRPAIDQVQAERGRRLWGSSDHTKLVLTLDPDMALTVEQETLVHEVLHCIAANTAHLKDGEEEEMVIEAWSPMLLDVLVRNPQLVAYLTR